MTKFVDDNPKNQKFKDELTNLNLTIQDHKDKIDKLSSLLDAQSEKIASLLEIQNEKIAKLSGLLESQNEKIAKLEIDPIRSRNIIIRAYSKNGIVSGFIPEKTP